MFIKTQGVGIKVDGKPVQHTLADPETNIKRGKIGLYILLFIFGVNALYFSLFEKDGFSFAIYFNSLLIVLLGIIKFKSLTKFSILSGLILAILESIIYLWATFDEISSGSITISGLLIIFILLRIL